MSKVVNIVLGPRDWVREPDRTDSWDYGDSDCEVSIETLEGGNPNYDGISTNLDFPFYAVYAKYFTGSTFGSEASGKVMGTFASEEDAEEFVAALLRDTSYSVPWNGYFESLDYIQIERVFDYTQRRRYRAV